MAQGSVAFDYSRAPHAPTVPAIAALARRRQRGPPLRVHQGPVHAYNVHAMVLKNVKIAGTVYNNTVPDTRLTCQMCVIATAPGIVQKL